MRPWELTHSCGRRHRSCCLPRSLPAGSYLCGRRRRNVSGCQSAAPTCAARTGACARPWRGHSDPAAETSAALDPRIAP
eukprot:scaffold126469_cov90-Phaeocystis_antarctica.AAC.2